MRRFWSENADVQLTKAIYFFSIFQAVLQYREVLHVNFYLFSGLWGLPVEIAVARAARKLQPQMMILVFEKNSPAERGCNIEWNFLLDICSFLLFLHRSKKLSSWFLAVREKLRFSVHSLTNSRALSVELFVGVLALCEELERFIRVCIWPWRIIQHLSRSWLACFPSLRLLQYEMIPTDRFWIRRSLENLWRRSTKSSGLKSNSNRVYRKSICEGLPGSLDPSGKMKLQSQGHSTWRECSQAWGPAIHATMSNQISSFNFDCELWSCSERCNWRILSGGSPVMENWKNWNERLRKSRGGGIKKSTEKNMNDVTTFKIRPKPLNHGALPIWYLKRVSNTTCAKTKRFGQKWAIQHPHREHHTNYRGVP